MPARPLSASEVAALDKPGVYRFNRALYIQIRLRPSATDPDAGVRSWSLRYQINGRPRWIGLGSASQLSLTQARRKAFKLQQLIVDGIDPLEATQAEKKAAAKVPTFTECAGAYIESHDKRSRPGRPEARRSRPPLAGFPMINSGGSGLVQIAIQRWRLRT